MSLTSFRARYVFPVVGPPIADGVVTIGDGRIVSVGPTPDAAAPAPQDLGNVAILPGLVNAHTHLQFSDLAQPLGAPGMAFPDWIREVVAHRRANLDADPGPAIERGLAECMQAGVTTIGDIGSMGWRWPQNLTDVPQGVIFHELIGLRTDRIEPTIGRARQLLAQPAPHLNWCAGLSPHAPYTVHPELLSQVVALTASANVPLAMHLAESREELQLLATGDGPFVKLLQDLDAWDATAIPRGSRPLDYLRALAQSPRSLVVHGNYLDDEEIAFLAANRDRMTVVYCPRTHAYFDHARHPLPKLLSSGAAVALGTDSRASNPDLSLFAEMRFISQQFPELPRTLVLELGTIRGARALGLNDRGELVPGARGDLVQVALPDRSVADPHELLFDPAAKSHALPWLLDRAGAGHL